MAGAESMAIELIPANRLPLELQKDWRRLQLAEPRLAGPCFHPLLYQSIAEHVPGVMVAVRITASGRHAFWPHLQTDGGRTARPVPACDYQSAIAATDEQWDVCGSLRRMNLKRWYFDNLLAFAGAQPPRFSMAGRSPRVLLDGGIDAYIAARKKAGRSGRNLRTHRRLMQRNHGPVRFVAQADGALVLPALLRWKADRFHGFADWARGTIERIHSRRDPEFGSVLSALYAGDTLVAAHFGLRCDGILHYWFPGFNPEFSRYSASLLLIEDLVAELPRLQCRILDLGPGNEPYKEYFANASIEIWSGQYDLSFLWSYAMQMKRSLKNFVLAHPLLHRAARPLAQLLRKSAGAQSRPK